MDRSTFQLGTNQEMRSTKRPLTVLMPVYNAEKYLAEAIESILKQTFNDFEFLIIDDGSRDSSKSIIFNYAKNDPRIKFVQNETNQGLVKTLNRGLSLVSTPLLARQDADDISKPERFEKQIRFMNENSNVALLGASFGVIGRENVLLPTRYDQILEILQYGNCFAHGSVVLRTQLFKDLGGYSTDAGTEHIEDYDAWARLAHEYKVANLPDVLYSYRIHDETISTKNQPQQFRNAVALSKRLIPKSPNLISPTIYGFSSKDDPSVRLRREQTLPQLFQAIKLVWKDQRKLAATWRLAMLGLIQPRFLLRSLRNHFLSTK
jgi:glycosyltransferase involved in cell wall biosynthesis